MISGMNGASLWFTAVDVVIVTGHRHNDKLNVGELVDIFSAAYVGNVRPT